MNSFSDAELGEDAVEDVLDIGFAGDGAEGVEGRAEVDGDEFRLGGGREQVYGTDEGSVGIREGNSVTRVDGGS